MKRGKDFEKQFFDGFKGTEIWAKRWPNCRYGGEAPADYFALHDKIFYAIECKSIRGKSLPFAALKDHQVLSLQQIDEHGGVSFVSVRYRLSRGKYRAFLLYLHTFLMLKRTCGRRSLHISAAEYHGIEMPRIRDNGADAWDSSLIIGVGAKRE